MRRLVLVAALLAGAALAGCTGARTSPVDVTPVLPLNDAQPGRPTDFALTLHSTSSFRASYQLRAEGMPEGWTFQALPASLDLPGGKSNVTLVRVTPGLDAAYGPHSFDVLVGDTRASVTVNVRDLGRLPLAEGMRANLTYVVLAANGTVLAANEPVVKDQPGLRFLRGSDETPDYTPVTVRLGNASAGRALLPDVEARVRGMLAGETAAVRTTLNGEDVVVLVRVVDVAA